MRKTFTVSEGLSRKGITPLKVNPLKVFIGMSSELLSKEGHNMEEEVIIIKAVPVREALLIGLLLMVVMATGLWNKLT